MEEKTYRFRAECLSDWHSLRSILPTQFVVNADVQKLDSRFPDVEIKLKSKGLCLKKLRDYCSQVADGHVMWETVAEEKDYTGERNYELHF